MIWDKVEAALHLQRQKWVSPSPPSTERENGIILPSHPGFLQLPNSKYTDSTAFCQDSGAQFCQDPNRSALTPTSPLSLRHSEDTDSVLLFH